MKNFKIIGWLFGLLFLLMCVGEVKAQNCSGCISYNENSFFCVQNGLIHKRNDCIEAEENGRDLKPFRFVGMNVRALTRMDDGELLFMLTEAKEIGATVIRFFAPNNYLSNDEAVAEVERVLDRAREITPNMKFIIVLANFYGDEAKYTPQSTDPEVIAKAKASYYPNLSGKEDPYRGGLYLNSDWFDTLSDVSYMHTYYGWVLALRDALSLDKYQRQILSFELGNELKNQAEASSSQAFRVQNFVNTMVSTIKSKPEFKALVSLGSTSTYHTLNLVGNATHTYIDTYRQSIYRTTNSTSTDMYQRVDFMTVHNYNNEWTSGGGTFHNQTEDIEYAMENTIPWVVEEFGYSGNATKPLRGLDAVPEAPTVEFFPGPGNTEEEKRWINCWQDIPTDGTSIIIPGIATEDEVSSQNRGCAIQTGIEIYKDTGATGVMAWGFRPRHDDPNGNNNRGIGGTTTEFDYLHAADYNYLEAAWAYGSFLFDPTYMYECSRETMNLNSEPASGLTNITCQGPTIKATHRINGGISIKYNATESIDFSADGTGYEALPGAVVEANIKEVDCLSCADPVPCTGQKLSESQENNQYQFTIQPNPFNAQTEIVFNLTEDAPVTIHVTDMMGRHVATLADDEMKTTGEHIVIFNGSQYPSGMYMTHIQVGEYSGTQKMILAK